MQCVAVWRLVNADRDGGEELLGLWLSPACQHLVKQQTGELVIPSSHTKRMLSVSLSKACC